MRFGACHTVRITMSSPTISRPPRPSRPVRRGRFWLLAIAATSAALASTPLVWSPTANAAVVDTASPDPAEAAAVAGAAADSRAGTFIVTLRDTVGLSATQQRAASLAGAERARALGAQVTHVYGHALNGYAAQLNRAQVTSLQRDPSVSAIVPDTFESSDADQSNPPWGLDRIDQANLPLDGKYTYTPYTGAAVNVFVIDSGVRTSHTDFGGRVAVGYTAISDGLGTGDCNGHGTHVAGTIAGTSYGVAKAATIVPVRVAGCTGTASSSNTVAGIDWILSERAKGRFPGSAVINMSMGHKIRWYEFTFPVEDALARAMNAGITTVLSAGNDNASACNHTPGRMTQAITVAATDRTDLRASYSNYGSCVDLFAPGSSIVSAGITSDVATATKSGTSMAAPHVAGAAARYLEEHPGEQPGIVGGSIMRQATEGVVGSAGSGSPNRLLRVSKPGMVVVPDVLGLSCSLASGEISAAGLVPRCSGVGTWVKSQSPLGGLTVLPGTVVTLTLSSGPLP